MCLPSSSWLQERPAGGDRAEGPAPLRLVCEVCAPSQGLQHHPARVTASTAELHTSQVAPRELMPTERETERWSEKEGLKGDEPGSRTEMSLGAALPGPSERGLQLRLKVHGAALPAEGAQTSWHESRDWSWAGSSPHGCHQSTPRPAQQKVGS